MKMIWVYLLASAMYALGYHVGKEYQRRKQTDEADAIHASVAKFIEAGERLRETTARPKTDPAATDPLPLKQGDADRALANGEFGQYVGRGGNS